jgi:phosphomannomutase
VGESLTPEVAARYSAAFEATLGPGPIVIGRDGRESGPMLSKSISETLVNRGRSVLDADVCATPTLGVLVRSPKSVGGIQITASHNPAAYNGLKLFSHDGRVIPAAAGMVVMEAFRGQGTGDRGQGSALSRVDRVGDTMSEHLRLISATVDVSMIHSRGFRVVLDSNAGAGSVLGRVLLSTLGCKVTLLGGEPNGQFQHPPEPTAENLAQVGQQVVAAKADIGFCQDPDADRLAIIDETGRYVGEEYTLALCLDHVLRQRRGPVVTNCATSRMAEDVAAKYGVPYYRSAVGEANVVDKMLEVGAVFGGEGNGGPIDPRVGLVRDSFVGMALVLAAMAERGKRVSELVDELPRYHIVKRTIQLAPQKLPAAFDALQQRFIDARADRLDGLRFDWPNRWLIVRGSNTEPIVRVIAEAPTVGGAEQLAATASEVISKL